MVPRSILPGSRRAGTDSPFVRSLMMVVIAASLLPILLGGVAENENMRRAMFLKMREEHLRRIAESREKMAARRWEREQALQAANHRPHLPHARTP